MEHRLARARTLVQSALDAIERELASPRPQICAADLGHCRETLRGYLDAIDRRTLPPRRERGEGLGKLVQDGWPYDLQLATLVIQAERAWRNA